jgi:Domain of unknown function (DUF6916)
VRISRSAFLKALGCAGLGTCLDVAVPSFAIADAIDDAGVASAPSSVPISVRDVSAARFRPHVGERFAVRTSANERAVLTLAEVTERPIVRGVEQFWLVFHAPPRTALPSALHVLSHPQLGTVELFISPIGPGNRPRAVYQACFNRHVPASGRRRT